MMRYFLAAIGAAVVICEAAMAQPITPPMSGITSRNHFLRPRPRRSAIVMAGRSCGSLRPSASIGRAGEGAYMCEDEARGDGNRRAGKGWREAVAPALATGVAR